MELCKWTVDLGNLPSFQHQANIAQSGFYTGECFIEAGGTYSRCRALKFMK